MFKKFIVVFIIVIGLPQTAHCRDDLLEFLIEKNEAAGKKIKTAEYRVKWTANLEVKDGRRHNEGFGEVKIKGNWRYSTQECNASVPATGWKQKQTQSMVLNDKYFAYWPSIGNAYIYQNDHQSTGELSDDSKMKLMSHSTPDMQYLNFAFGGDKETTFKAMMKQHPDKIKWTAEESKQSDGDTTYYIKRYSPFMNNPEKPDAVWTIDPQKGFLVTRAVFYGKDGNVWIERKTEAKELGNEIWFPVSFREIRYDDSDKVTEKPNHSISIQLEDISVNKEISDESFAIDVIFPKEYRDTTTVFRTGPDGQTKAYIYKYGRYIPRESQYAISQLAESLVGKPLPSFDNIRINLTGEQMNSGLILVCFFDMEQRPSRNCILQLSKRVQELKAKGIVTIAVQTSKIDKGKLDEWIKDNDITIPMGIIKSDFEKTLFTWGVKSLPWLILTDKEHIVTAEGFSLDELDEKIRTSAAQ
jgi:hypothetical protein